MNLEPSKPKKFFYLIIGSISLFFGIIGIMLPIIPTTPFVLLSAWCFYRGSSKFHDWLINHPNFGPIIDEFGNEEGMSRESKIKAIAMTWVAVLLTVFFVLDTLEMRLLIIGLASIGTLIILKLKTQDE